MNKTIPENAFQYKEGLYINEFEASMGTLHWTVWELYAVDGWYFYDLEQPENYNEEGELLPPEELVYAKFMTMRKNEEYVTNNIIPVPVVPGRESV